MEKPDIKDIGIEELANYFASINEKPYRVKQLIFWLYQKSVSDFRDMSDLSLDLRKKLESHFSINRLYLVDKKISGLDDTRKFLFKLEDGNLIESVLIPNINRMTTCLSTQVGCKFKCSFCASGKAGFVRDLRPSEIINQLQFMVSDVSPAKVNNVVFMGMGEPLDNYANLLKAIRIINYSAAFNIGARKITISTCGIPSQIDKLSAENMQFELSVSLHAARNDLRASLMPVNSRYPLEELIESCRKYTIKTKRIITFEYILISEVNDSAVDARELAILLRGLKCKVNLIVCNTL
ncbi:MAG: 23S rRNA (adenine(2503)-C(2))-methyltransferase RlmN, partial [Candidatus Omnitrophica bacterium]|nr:23S rRNA (adenine(2503)-C(2))-methyltransferase RlmN [Candidatus Omnitrophota bacterium]